MKCKYHIEHDPQFCLANYFVMDEGYPVQVCITLWGAKRWIRKHSNDKITKFDAYGRSGE